MSISVTFEQGTGFSPRIVRMVTTSTLAQVTAAGWYKNAAPNQLVPSDKVEVYYSQGSSLAANAFFDVSIAAGVVTLSVAESNIVLPVVAGNFAVFAGTSGAIADLGYLPSDATKTRVVMAGSAVQVGYIAHFIDITGTIDDTAGAVINAGNIQAGLPGTAGSLISFPPTAANGSLILAAVNAGGAFNMTISNATIGQSSVMTVPNPVNAVGRFLVAATATPFVSGEFPVASGTGGLMVSSGLAAANIQNKTNIIANRTANIGGGGAGPLSVVVAGLTAASIVTASIQASSNVVSVSKVTATATGFDILFSADPGATCTVNYVAFIAAQ